MGGCNSHFGGNTMLMSGNKNTGGKQMISICTQDYQVTEMMQSPMQQEGKRGQKSAEPEKKG